MKEIPTTVNPLGSEIWQELKKGGSSHYKIGEIEPIDLYRQYEKSFVGWALLEISAHALRNLPEVAPKMNRRDLDKIQHYAKLLEALIEDAE